jgi:hypothetical protein
MYLFIYLVIQSFIHYSWFSVDGVSSYIRALSCYRSDSTKRRIQDDVEGSGNGQISGNIPYVALRDWEEPWTLVRIGGFRAESLNRQFPNSHKPYPLNRLATRKTWGAKQIKTEKATQRKTETKQKCIQKTIKGERKTWLNEINK